MWPYWCLFLLPGLAKVYAAARLNCTNGGLLEDASNTTCTCPPGFGGTECANATCDTNAFQTTFSLAPNNNISACSSRCDDGWTGPGCAICTSPTSCNTAFLANGGTYPWIVSQSTTITASAGGGDVDGNNFTLTCNNRPVFATTGFVKCDLNVRRWIFLILTIYFLTRYLLTPGINNIYVMH